jgi:hypothetical protein
MRPVKIKQHRREAKPIVLTFKRARIVGLGQFDSGVVDLGSDKKHLEGFGKACVRQDSGSKKV